MKTFLSVSQYEYDLESLTVIVGALLFSEGNFRTQRGCVSGSLRRVGLNPQASLSPAHCSFHRLLRLSP